VLVVGEGTVPGPIVTTGDLVGREGVVDAGVTSGAATGVAATGRVPTGRVPPGIVLPPVEAGALVLVGVLLPESKYSHETT
jgi:hypothetical protein